MHNFEFVKPSTIADAVKAMGGDGAQALSGGQTLTPTMKQRLASPAVLVSLTGIAEMKGVCMGDGGLSIGAATTHAVVAAEALTILSALFIARWWQAMLYNPGGFQQEFHIPSLPPQTVHLEAKAMGHNMLTLNSAWSVAVIGEFFSGVGPTQR